MDHLNRKTLTPRQHQILRMVCDGESASQIGRALNISEKTVASHRANIRHRAGVQNIAQLVRWAIQRGYLEVWEFD